MFNPKSKCAIAGRPCPQNGNPERGDFCPAWWQLNYENQETGQVQTNAGCGFTHLPHFLQNQTAEVRVASDTVQKARSEVQQASRQAAGAAMLAVQVMEQTGQRVERAMLAGGGLVELAGRTETRG